VHDEAASVVVDRAGLSTSQAAQLLATHGPNELAQTSRRNPLRDLADQLVHPLALLLWVAAALAWLIHTPVLTIAIVVVILLNAVFAFVQERQGERAVEALMAYLPQQANVRRDGQRREIPARDLVPGDVIELKEGDRVCADARLLEGALEIDMSAINGESLPTVRSAGMGPAPDAGVDTSDRVFSGTSCTGGDALAVVTATGMSTEIGRIASLTQGVRRESSPLERQVRRVAWLIAFVSVGVGLAFIPLGAFLAGLSLQDATSFAIGLIVANVPEGLLPTITLALAVAVRELARAGALVKRLSAVETLGATSVICTDKTGTLTENRMHAVLVWTTAGEMWLGGARPAESEAAQVASVVDVLSRCNTAEVNAPAVHPHDDPLIAGDPTEVALLMAAHKLGGLQDLDEVRAQRRRMFHFDPALRMMTTVDQVCDELQVHSKGAPEEVLARCTHLMNERHVVTDLDEVTRTRILDAVSRYAARGLRLIATATRVLPDDDLPELREQVERDLTFGGFVGLLDPARPQVREAVDRCHSAGIRILVVTGDHRLTATQIAREVGIGGAAPISFDASDLDAMPAQDFNELLDQGQELIVARSSPEMKMRIAEALQATGHVIAMTGDGVNDAPALRRADIGVAMGRSGTDVAREAATMVLTDDNFRTIADAVEAGRRIYDNVRKFVLYIFAHATPEVVPFLLFALSGGRIPLPITVLQILCIDIGTETLPALALGRERAEPGLMARPPRPKSERLIQGPLLLRAWLLLGGVSAVLVTAGFLWTLREGGWAPGDDVSADAPLHHIYLQATTMTFLGIVWCQLGTAMAARTEKASLRQIGVFSNRLLLWGIAFELGFATFIIVTPGVNEILGMELPPPHALLCLPFFALAVWGVDELVRYLRRQKEMGATRR
jgi:calcium-translocating P-type ATPase